MIEWWNSLSAETLRSINTWGQVLGIVCTAGLVISSFFVFASSGRLSQLAAKGEKVLREQVQRTQESLKRAEDERRPRTLTNQDFQSLRSALGSVQRGKIDVESIMGDIEGDAYANQFENLFSVAGWQVTRARATGNHGIQPGLRLIVPTTDAGRGVAASFARSGLSFNLEHAPIDYVWLRIGTKPTGSVTK